MDNSKHDKKEKFLIKSKDYNEVKEKVAFTKFIQDKIRSLKYYENIRNDELADQLGVSKEFFRKIVNKQKPNQSRDCIIALCIALKLDQDDINTALESYNHVILNKEDERDNLIINFSNGETNELISVKELNKALDISNLETLNIIKRRNKTKIIEKTEKYIIEESYVNVYSDEFIYGDRYNSLSTKYPYDKDVIKARMLLYHLESKKKYLLEVSGDSFIIESDDENLETQILHNNNETGEFKPYFQKLLVMKKAEQKKLLEIYNDTINYGLRLGAGIKNNNIHIYAEEFNYRIPERKEYYLMEYINGIFRLSISNKSMFMTRYLSPDDYYQSYSKDNQIPFKSYDSIEEIKALLNQKSKHTESDTILRFRLITYNKMKESLVETLGKIKNREVFIRNLDYIWEDRDRVCLFYNLEKEFECKIIEEAEVIVAKKRAADITSSNGDIINISILDLYRAFELGFNDIDEICYVKQKYNDIESILT